MSAKKNILKENYLFKHIQYISHKMWWQKVFVIFAIVWSQPFLNYTLNFGYFFDIHFILSEKIWKEENGNLFRRDFSVLT